MREISRVTERTTAEIYGVATFYAQFRFTPSGKHVMKVCHGTALPRTRRRLPRYRGRAAPRRRARQHHEDGEFTVEKVACLGCCSLAPVVMIDGEVYGQLTGDKLGKIVAAVGGKASPHIRKWPWE